MNSGKEIFCELVVASCSATEVLEGDGGAFTWLCQSFENRPPSFFVGPAIEAIVDRRVPDVFPNCAGGATRQHLPVSVRIWAAAPTSNCRRLVCEEGYPSASDLDLKRPVQRLAKYHCLVGLEWVRHGVPRSRREQASNEVKCTVVRK